MKPPTNTGELETFLGIVTYLSKFAPNLSEVTSPLRVLLTQNVEFHWDKPQADDFQKAKDIMTANPVLAYFDPKKEVTLQVDASKLKKKKCMALSLGVINSTSTYMIERSRSKPTTNP